MRLTRASARNILSARFITAKAATVETRSSPMQFAHATRDVQPLSYLAPHNLVNLTPARLVTRHVLDESLIARSL